MLFEFDKGASEWHVRTSADGKDDPLAELAPAPSRPGRALKVNVDFPGDHTVWTGRVRDLQEQWRKKSASWQPGAIRGFDWSRLDRLSFDVYLPQGAPRSTQLLL
ncbi:MAG: hypothetical protein FJ278_20380, partial [Planctomycetes bacterium]|nr:hypothetical protein [Planctomycetota bacterium]